MSDLVRHLSRYAAYHRDGRNVATHMVGIPAIVLAVAALASRPVLGVGGVAVTPAMAIAAAAALFYLRLDLRFGLVMTVLLALACRFGLMVAAGGTGLWLAIALGGFAGGWVLQFLGHHFEGRKPAFLDDVSGLAVGPLFIVAEIAFACGLRREVRRAMASRADG